MNIIIITGLCCSGKTFYCDNLNEPILIYDNIYKYSIKNLDYDKIDIFIEKYKLNKNIYLDAYNNDLIYYLIKKFKNINIEIKNINSKFIYTDIDDYYELLAIKEPRVFNQEIYDKYVESIKNTILNIKSNLEYLKQRNIINEIKYLYRKNNYYKEYNNDSHLLTILNETKINRILKYIDNISGDKNYQSIILDNEYIRKGYEKDWITLENIKKCINFKNKIVMDTGCFNGYFSFKSIKEGAKKVIGVDHNNSAIKICKKLCIYNNYHLWKNGKMKDVSCELGINFLELKIGKDDIFKDLKNKIDIILVLNYLHHLKRELGEDIYFKVIDSFFKKGREIIFEINDVEIEDIDMISKKNNFKLNKKIESHRKTSYGNRWILYYNCK